MNRLAKLFQVVSGIFLLGNVVLFFLPLLKIEQENYAAIIYSQLDYVGDLAQGEMTGEQKIFVLLGIALPLALSVICGLWNIFAGRYQIVSCIGGVFVAACNGAFWWKCGILEPERLNQAQQYTYQISLKLLPAFSLAAAVLGILGLLLAPRRKKGEAQVHNIPAVENSSQEQIQPSHAFEDEKQTVSEVIASHDEEEASPKEPRGVMVGVSGIFAGAEIPVRNGETLKLGRGVSNDLVFTDAKKVSREHCAITWDSAIGSYQILDKSSNGCFINGSDDCLPQNMSIMLPPGTILDIGSEENRFRLE